MYLEDSSNKFWIIVDKRLEEIKKECAQPDRISFTEEVLLLFIEFRITDLNDRALNEIYKQDLTAYPPEDDALLSEAHPTTTQSEINRHIRSRS